MNNSTGIKSIPTEAGRPSAAPAKDSAIKAGCNRMVRLLSAAAAFAAAAAIAAASQLTLTWNDNSDNEIGFKIERSQAGGNYGQIGQTPADVTSYVDTALDAGSSYSYRVRAYNLHGDSEYSNVATAETDPAPAEKPSQPEQPDQPDEPEPAQPATIVLQPADTFAYPGGEAIFAVQATGDGLEFQWTLNGSPIAGATQASYIVESVSAADAGNYAVSVGNPAGTLTSASAKLELASIAIESSPVSQRLDRFGRATLSVAASGPNLAYQWYRGESGDESSPIAGARQSEYTPSPDSQGGKYWAKVTSQDRTSSLSVSARSAAAELSYESGEAYYFGSIGSGEGDFGIMLRADLSGVFLGHIGSGQEIVSAIDVGADGAFSFPSGSGLVLGDLADGQVSGSANGLPMSGRKAAADGPTAAYAGLYEGVAIGSSDGELMVIAGPDGDAYTLKAEGDSVASGRLGLDAQGRISASLHDGTAVELALSASSGQVLGTISRSGQSFKAMGRSEGTPRNDRLSNTSIRSKVRSGAGAMIAGFAISGEGTRRVLIRGVGPTLAQFGVDGALGDPSIALFRQGESEPFATNEDWGDSNAYVIGKAIEAVGAFALPRGSADAALVLDLPAGTYTAQVSGKGGSSGAAIVEVYDVPASETSSPDAQLSNISMRSGTGAGGDAVFGGFVVTGDTPKRVLVRAVGPELAGFGVDGSHRDPFLTVYRSHGGESTPMASNDDWSENRSVVQALGQSVGAFPLQDGSKSAALAIWLEPGVYTAQASGADSSEGITIVEIYEDR